MESLTSVGHPCIALNDYTAPDTASYSLGPENAPYSFWLLFANKVLNFPYHRVWCWPMIQSPSNMAFGSFCISKVSVTNILQE